jgi:beta-phosphoglucomutase
MACVEILLSLAGKTSSEAEKVEFAERKNGWYRDYIASIDESAVLPGVRDFVGGCRTIGLPVAVASASKNAMDILVATGLLPLFDAVVDGNAVSTAKPDPEVFLAAARKLGIKGEDCLVFEDAAAGIEGAIAASMRVVGIGDPEKLVRADIVMPGFAGQSPTELLAMLGRP